MAQVPYSGTLQVAPQDTPIGRDSVQATPEMFGATVGNAIQQLGKTEDNVGNEIFARGLAMQDLYNHSQAQEADAQYAMAAGQTWEKMKSLSGKDAVDYYTSGGYQKDLADARTNIRDGLPNGMAQKMFDSTSLSTFVRTNLYGAGRSGDENRKYAISTAGAKVQVANDQALAQPTDDNAFQSGLDDVESNTRFQAQASGLSPEAEDEAVAKAKSNLWAQRITGLVRGGQPLKAKDMLDDAMEDGQIRGEDNIKLTNMVQSANHTTGARMISNEVMTGGGNRWGQGSIDIKQAGEAIKQIESGGNYGSIGVQTAHGRALGAYQVMTDFLPDYLAKAGLPSMTPAEFLQNHAVQDQVFAANFGASMKQYGSANDAASVWLTGKPQATAGDVKDALGTNSQAYVARFNAALAQKAPLSAQVDMGSRIAAERMPDDPLFPDFVRDRIEMDHTKQNQIKRDDIWQAQQPIENTLIGATSQNGKLPTTVEELTADPQVANAWDKLGELNPAKQRYYLNVLARNAKGDHALTPETLKQYTGFTGEAIQRPADFVNENILDTDLPIAKKSELIKLQQSIQGKTDQGNPAVMQTMKDSADIINAAGITKKNTADYDQFTGQLADQLRQWSQDNQKPPNFEQRQTIVSRLLQQQHSDEFWFKGSTDNMYKLPVPPGVKKEVQSAHPEWTDEQIQREYSRQKYQKLYGSTPKPEPGK